MVALPWLVATIILSNRYNDLFVYTSGNGSFLHFIGTVLMLVGLAFYFSTLSMLLKGLKESRLLKKYSYYLCQNPLYASLILFVLPALSFILNSWLVITTSIVAYILFKVFIKNETRDLEMLFGEDYLKYKAETPELLPFPVKKWLSLLSGKK